MECISVFDMLKIGIGPSSSHTLGPWRAAEKFVGELQAKEWIDHVNRVTVDLYGSYHLPVKTCHGPSCDVRTKWSWTGIHSCREY